MFLRRIHTKILVTCAILISHVALQAQNVDKDADKDDKKVNFAAVPILDYSNSTGLGVGFLGQAFYKVNKNDSISPLSSSGVYGLYTTNGTWFGALFQRLYLNEDQWRLLGCIGAGTINYQYFQEIPLFGGAFVGFNTKADFALVKVERKVIDNFYAGVIGIYSNSKTVFDLPEFIPPELVTDYRSMNSLGYTLAFDKRDHQITPYEGYNISFRNNFYRDWIGSDNTFQAFNLVYNHFYPIQSEKHIVATRISTSIATGDVPFQGQNVVGQDDIRGYTEGKYRDNQVYAVQAEYRHRFKNRFGAVGFLGIATAMESFSQLKEAPFLPGGGVGVRYMVVPKERINIGMDFALGKDDWGIYFRIGESFGR